MKPLHNGVLQDSSGIEKQNCPLLYHCAFGASQWQCDCSSVETEEMNETHGVALLLIRMAVHFGFRLYI